MEQAVPGRSLRDGLSSLRDEAGEPASPKASIPSADAELIYQALRFSFWAAGEGFCPVAGEDAEEPAEFFWQYSQRTGDNDWETLAERFRLASTAEAAHGGGAMSDFDPSSFDPSRGFHDWWMELEGWSFRGERAVDDLQVDDFRVPRLRAWLEAAYLTGFHARDSDGSPEGGDAKQGSVRSTTARAEGIAETPANPLISGVSNNG